jgi:7-cyano-7-deazaguanine synthase
VFTDDLDSPELGQLGVLLYSGGFDSTLLAHSLIRRGKRLIGLSIDFPGRPAAEIDAARKLALRIGFAEHLSIGLDLPWRPVRGEVGGMNEGWFPHRNIMFLGLALHLAEVKGADFVAAGYARTDGIVFTDARPEFLQLFAELARMSSGNKSTSRQIDVVVPFFEKDAIYRAEAARFPDLPALISRTWSCWRDEKQPCGVCATCRERAYYFEELGVPAE